MEPDSLTPEELAAVEEEETLLRFVQTQMALAAKRRGSHANFDAELLSLRDQLAEERAEDHAMLVEHMTRLAALRATQNRDEELPADPRSPYFAHLRLRDMKDGEPRLRDVLVGRRAFIDTQLGVQIVDWRNSPISRIYYCYRDGDEYEETFAKEMHTGHVALRRTLNIQDGVMRRMQQGDMVLVKGEDGHWRRLSADRSRLSGGVGTALRAPADRLGRYGPDQRLPEITALIDPEQFRIITGRSAGVVIISGGAGTGKTTIALHRAAFLHFEDPKRYTANRMLVITPGDALRRYVAKVLPTLDVNGVPIKTFPQWALETVKRLVPELRKRKLTDETPSGARRLKRHPAILSLFEKAVTAEARSMEERLEAAGGAPLLQAWVKRRTLPPVQRVTAVLKWLRGRDGQDAVGQRTLPARKALERAKAELGDPFETWATLMTDLRALRSTLDAVGATYYEWEVEQLVDTVSAQSDDPADVAHLDAHMRQGIDGRALDEGDLRGRLDTDDLAAILRICELKYGRLEGPSGQVAAYEHVLVDEAQDLSPLCLKVLTGAVRPGGPVTLAGDTAQRLHLDNGFGDWDELVAHLKVKAHILPPLAVSYRSTRQVMKLARHVLGDLAPDLVARDAHGGAPVELFQFDETGEAVGFLADALKSLRERERRATVALVSREPAVAELYYKGLARAEVPNLRRVRQQDFEFTPGVDVTDVFQIKGLEYDYIVVLEPSAGQYPATVESRHLLHVAMTRAAHQLWLVCSKAPSPLLPDALIQGEGWDDDEALEVDAEPAPAP
jgi:DNA helicase II / ATP-dependent DNA helicase PcrA